MKKNLIYLITLKVFLFLFPVILFSATGNKKPPFDITLKIFQKPPFDISIPEDAVIYIEDKLQKKLTKVLLMLNINQIKVIAKDFNINYPANVSKRNLINIVSRNLKITDMTQRQSLQDNRSRRDIMLQRYRSQRQKGIIIHNADEVVSIQKKRGSKSKRIFIFGHVDIEYQKRKFKADLIVIKIKNRKAQEIMGLGNVSLEEKNLFMMGTKFFYYPKTKKGVLYNPKTYSKPFYIKSRKIKMVRDDLVILNDMTATTCDLDNAHYHISASRTFIYQNDKYVFFNVAFKVGQSPFFWTPIYVHSMYGTGVKTAIGFERGISWFIHNTYTLNLKNNSKFKIMFDYYQKLGIYAGIEAKIPYTEIKLAGAYDRHVLYKNIEDFRNYFEEVPGEGPVSGRSLRGKVEFTFSHDIMKFFKTNVPFSLNFKLNYKEHTDPYFSTQFETRRQEINNYFKIFKPDFTPSSVAPYRTSDSGTGRSIGYDLGFKYKNISLTFSGSWLYRMAKTNDPANSSNPYKTEYWENYKQTFTFPSISLSSSFNLFDMFYLWGLKKTSDASLLTPLDREENQLRKTQKGWVFNWPFTITPTMTYTRQKYYSFTNGDVELESDVIKKKLGFTINAPVSIDYNLKKVTFKWEVPIQAYVDTNEQITQDPTVYQLESDKLNTINSYNINSGAYFSVLFLQNYEYLGGKFRGGLNYSQSSKFGENITNSEQYNRSETINYSVEFEWFKTSIKLTFGYNYSPNVTNRKGILSVTSSTRLIPFFTISDTYTYDRDKKMAVNNTLTITLTGLENVRIYKSFFLKKTYLNVSWTKDFINFKNNYASWSYGFDFGISDHTTFSISVRGENKKLYAYTDRAEEGGIEGGKRNFFNDFFKSLNFFNTQDRIDSLFKVTSFDFNIVHMLHKWKLEFKFRFYPTTLDNSGTITFIPSIFFVVTLTDLPGIQAPPIQNRYAEQAGMR